MTCKHNWGKSFSGLTRECSKCGRKEEKILIWSHIKEKVKRKGCSVCGTPLKKSWQKTCHSCYKKTELRKNGTIEDTMERLGEKPVSEKSELDYKMGTNRRKSWDVKK